MVTQVLVISNRLGSFFHEEYPAQYGNEWYFVVLFQLSEIWLRRHKLYLPLKYIPLTYLLNYSTFKSFVSEILTFDSQKNRFKFVEENELEEITKKYSENCKSKLNRYKNKNDTEVFKNCVLYENEYFYNYEYLWFIYTSEKIKVFKFKIILPLITSFRFSNF